MTQWLVRRGLLVTVPVASLLVAVGACSSDSIQPGDGSDAAHPSLPPADGVEIEAAPEAANRLERLTRQFTRVPAPPKAAPAFKFPAGVIPPKEQPPEKPIEPRPVLSKGEAGRFIRQGHRIRAEVDASLKAQTLIAATVDVPASADGFVRVQPDNSPTGIEFAAKGANSRVAAQVSDGTALYSGAAPGGGDIVLRITRDSVEDFVVLPSKPAHPYVDYAVNVSEVAGLRLYDNTLEFLAPNGDPQVRVKPPRVIDADGVIHAAQLELSDCKADTSGLPPWDRPVTAPGASECNVRVVWDDTKVVYPAIVDPVWATAGSLATARYRAAATRLATGFVMTCGGIGDLGIAIASCESFNPAGNGGAGTWAATTAMNTARNDFTMFMLNPASTNVVAVGGNGVYTSERYNGSSWTTSTGDFSAGYFNPVMPAMTNDGQYIVLIDYVGTPYRLLTSTNTWSVGTQNPTPIQTYRYGSLVLQIPGQNTILRVGGYYSSTYLSSAERYRPSLDTGGWVAPTCTAMNTCPPWTTPGNAASMTVPRADAASVVLDSNRVMVYGGYTGAVWASTAEIFSGSGNTWSFATGPMPNNSSASQYNRGITAAFHGSGKMLSNNDQNLYIYDPNAASAPFTQLSTYQQGFYAMGSQANVVTAGSKVLMVPVQPQGSSGAQTACRLFDFGEKGSICSATAECQAGLTCVQDPYDGVSVCCDSACTNGCMSCRATNKTSGTDDGTCGPRKTNQYVGDTVCPYSASSTCGNTGYYCDGAGACRKYDTSTQCGAPSCVDADTQNDTRYCDGAGACEPASTTDCDPGYLCAFNSCYDFCYNDVDYCDPDYYCDTSTTWPGTCTAKKSDGASCNFNNAECINGNCVDGVCCDSACSGTCEACTNALTGQATGSCKPISAGTDPQNDCGDSGAASCAQNGLCNGAGACQLYASGTTCVAATCASATSRNNTDTCNGTGTCVDGGVTPCATGYACVSGVCQTSCTTDSQCASNHYCDTANGQCVADKSLGQSCARDAVCSGNANCVDGVCCDSSCTGSCRSCLKARNGGTQDGYCGNIVDDTDPENECARDVGYPASCEAPGTCDGQGACRVYAKAGVQCSDDVCSTTSASALETSACDGAGNCKPKLTQCYPYQCSGSACKVACTSGTQAADCVEGSFCQNGSCVGQKLNGEPCLGNSECKSTFCVDVGVGALAGDPDTGEGGAGNEPDYPGVCCDKACGNNCEACKKSIKGEGEDGTCGFVKDHTDPAGDCDVDQANPCGHNGACNGAGSCRNAPDGTSCGVTSCLGNSARGQICDGQGFCKNDSAIPCAPYVCADVGGAFQCANPCADDNDCQDGYYCTEMACKKKLANGQACESNGICSSGYCVDGVCCNASCNGQCEACAEPGSEGSCVAVEGQPRGSRTQCDHAGEDCGGSCDGVNAAACKYAPSGTECGDNTCTNAVADSSSCDGQGACRANDPERCLPYACGEDNKCLNLCQLDDDCSSGFRCDVAAQSCVPDSVAAECSEDGLDSVGQNGIKTPCKPFLCVPSSGTCAVSCAFTTDCAPDFVCEASTKTCLPAPPPGDLEEEGCACRAAGAPTRSSNHYLALVALGLAVAGLRRRQRPQLSE